MAKLPRHLKNNISLLDMHSHVGVDPLLYFTHSFPYCYNLREAFEDNQRAGISHAVIFPWVTSFYYDIPSLIKGRIKLGGKIGNAPFHFENEQMLRQLYEIFPKYRSRFIPFAVVDTLRETRKQVRVLDKLLSDYPFYGLKIHPRATQAHVATLLDEGKPLLDFARVNNLPFLIHTTRWPQDPLSQVSEVLKIARACPRNRFCIAHFCSFNQRLFEEADRMENVWVDTGAMSIGCDLVLQRSSIYESGKAKIPSDYRKPYMVFAEMARRFPETLMWGSDNPAHTFICAQQTASGKKVPLQLWSSLEREVDLLRKVRGTLRKKVAVDNALKFIEG